MFSYARKPNFQVHQCPMQIPWQHSITAPMRNAS